MKKLSPLSWLGELFGGFKSDSVHKRRLYKRIVHIISEDGPGGGPNTVQRHIKYYYSYYDIVFLHGGSGKVVEYCNAEGVRDVRLPIDRLWKLIWGWIPLFYQLFTLKPDLLILHGQWAGPVGAVLGRLAGIKSIIYIAQWPSFYTDWDLYRVVRNHIAEALPVNLSDKTVCISTGNLYQYQIRFPKHHDKLLQISNPFDLTDEPTHEDGEVIRKKFGWANDQIHVVSVGRLATQKHFEWLLQSWVLVQSKVPEARLWIVGGGEEDAMLRSLAKELSIGSSCTFLGNQKQGLRFINASDFVAMTTLYEGHANIPMEAHLCSKAIVANAVDGVVDSIRDGEDGFLVCPGDIQTFADRIITLCHSKETRDRMGKKGHENVEKFSMDRVMIKYSKLIQSLI